MALDSVDYSSTMVTLLGTPAFILFNDTFNIVVIVSSSVVLDCITLHNTNTIYSNAVHYNTTSNYYLSNTHILEFGIQQELNMMTAVNCNTYQVYLIRWSLKVFST